MIVSTTSRFNSGSHILSPASSSNVFYTAFPGFTHLTSPLPGITNLSCLLPGITNLSCPLRGFSSSSSGHENSIHFTVKNNKTSEVVRWQQVFGIGSTILASFLALSTAAWFWDWTDLLSLNLFSTIYWLFLYITMYMANLSERTKGIFRKMKASLTQVKDKPEIVFFLNI